MTIRIVATIKDLRADLTEEVRLLPFKDEDTNEECYLRYIEHNKMPMFEVLEDEGSVWTKYFYPVHRYSIISLKLERGGDHRLLEGDF